MNATFKPCILSGSISAPPSKSMAHRYLIGAALSQGISLLSGVDYSEDILASIDCIRALGAKVSIADDTVSIDPRGFMKVLEPTLCCRESGSTLRFFIPLALCLGQEVMLHGSRRLFERPLDVYEFLCRERQFKFSRSADAIKVFGRLERGEYQIRGDISSQFVSGLIFALVFLNEESVIQILPPFESKSYVKLTISALRSFGAEVSFVDEQTISVKKGCVHPFTGRIEGDFSNAAYIAAFNSIGSQVRIHNLCDNSLQGDRVYAEYFNRISEGTPTLDISDCPDLGPVLFALAAMKNGAVFTGTERLRIKESDRGKAMHEEIQKLGGEMIFGNNTITVPKQTLKYHGVSLSSHNDHRIVMALSLILSRTGGTICDAHAVKKSYPGYFDDICRLGAEVTLN